jgi:glycerophosphoryl diester phosphodiesterase
MAAVGTEVVLMGPLVDGNTTGLDDDDALAAVPDDFGGWLWTNRIDRYGPGR